MSLRIEARNERKRCTLDVEHLVEATTDLDPRVDDLLGSVEESVFQDLGSVLPDLIVRPPALKKLRVSVMPEQEAHPAIPVADQELSEVKDAAMFDLCNDLLFDELMLPGVVVRPSPFDKLCVKVSSDKDKKVSEWETDLALSVFPELAELGDDATRVDRLCLLETIDRDAFFNAFPNPHLPPVLH